MKKGFSLPLWVAGAARSALKKLVGLPFENYELIKIPHEKKEIKIEIHSVGLLKDDSHALGITFAKSGLDLEILYFDGLLDAYLMLAILFLELVWVQESSMIIFVVWPLFIK